jgi:hypothetical protein
MVGCFLIGTESNLLVTQRQPSSPTAVQYHAQGVLQYMDKFVTKVQTYQNNRGKECMHHRYEPYPTKGANDTTSLNGGASKRPTQRALTRHLLNTLCDESNPITHSDIGLRSGQSS